VSALDVFLSVEARRALEALIDKRVEAALREIEELVAPGALVWLDFGAAVSPRRYPAHRRSDWLNKGGRLICGICHPRVGGEA
jgi:hypothetical protein